MRKLFPELKEIALIAGNIALTAKEQGLIIKYKGDNSPVTNADQEISDFIFNRLQSLTPDIPVICEEQPRLNPNEIPDSFWLVDPIDGTKSYLRGESTYTVNIALIENYRSVLGLIYLPDNKKLYYAAGVKNLIIECEDKNLPKLERKSDDEFIAVIGARFYNKNTKDFLRQHSIKKTIAISSSVKLGMLAEGVADVYPKFDKTMEWDIAAGHALLKAGGGNILDLEGNELTYGKPGFINPYFIACGDRWLKNLEG